VIYLKVGIAAALCALFFWLGGLHSKTELEGFQAAQSANTARAVLAERASSAAELARVNLLLKGYQDAPPDPIVVSIGSRVLQYARIADCPVPTSGANPAATLGAAPVPRSDPEFERLLQTAFNACAHDAEELTTLQKVWPR
jgi:hypothetical protein